MRGDNYSSIVVNISVPYSPHFWVLHYMFEILQSRFKIEILKAKPNLFTKYLKTAETDRSAVQQY